MAWKHKLDSIDVDKKTAICSYCGPITVTMKSRGVSKPRLPKCPEGIREQRGDRSKYQGQVRHSYKSANGYHSVSQTTREKMFLSSTQCCEICESPLTLKTARYDHCHETGKFRGWLCQKCNSGLGALGDNVEGLQRALEYLKERSNGTISSSTSV